MQAAGGIEPSRIRRVDERRDHRSAGRRRQPAEGRRPGAIERNAAPASLMGDLAGREHDQRPASAQPDVCSPQAGEAPGRGLRPLERINEEAARTELGNAGQQVIGEQANIGAHAPEHVHQYQTVERAGRMVRGDDQGTASGYLSARGIDHGLDRQLRQHPTGERFIWIRLERRIDCLQCIEAGQPGEEGPRDV
jgi:hypothetical protein